MDVDRERPKKRLRIPRLHRTRKRRRNYVEVKDEDLIWTTWSERLPRVLLAWSFGFIGTFFLWLGLLQFLRDWDRGRSTLPLVASRNARSRNTIALFWTRTQSWNLVSWSELFSLQGESHEQ